MTGRFGVKHPLMSAPRSSRPSSLTVALSSSLQCECLIDHRLFVCNPRGAALLVCLRDQLVIGPGTDRFGEFGSEQAVERMLEGLMACRGQSIDRSPAESSTIGSALTALLDMPADCNTLIADLGRA